MTAFLHIEAHMWQPPTLLSMLAMLVAVPILRPLDCLGASSPAEHMDMAATCPCAVTDCSIRASAATQCTGIAHLL